MNPTNPPPISALPPDDDLFGWKLIFHWVSFVLRAPLRHRWLSAAAFLFVFSLGCSAIFAFPFRYQVQATLLAGNPQASALSNQSERIQDAPTRGARDVLLRRENLRAILAKTNFVEQYLDKRPWAIRTKDAVIAFLRGETRSHEDLVDGLVDTLAERLWVETRPEGTLAITFQWWDAELARQIVDAAQESFIDARRASEVQAIGEAIVIVEAQQSRLESEIKVAIDAFEKKQAQLRIAEPSRPRPVQRAAAAAPDPDLARLRAELASAQRTLSDLEGFRRRRTSELQATLAQQETIYASDHPALTSTRRVLSSLSEPTPRVAELGEEIRALEEQIAKRSGARTTVVSTHAAGAPYLEARLRLDAEDPRLDFERGQLENLLRQHGEQRNRIQGLEVQREVAEAAFLHRYRVVAPAKLPRGPVKPYPLIFLMGGLMGGLAFAFFAAAAADVRGGLIIERWQVEEQLELPVLVDLGQ